MPSPLVSFVIAVHDGAPFLDHTLASVAAQTHRRLEVVVVDDGSTDASPVLLDAWSRRDARIRVIRVPHGGPQRARNVGVAEARGDFVAHLDHDDVASPARVATQLAWMERHAVDVCGSCTRVFGDDGDAVCWVPERHDDILRESVFRCAVIHPTVLLPASIARRHPFNERDRCGGAELPLRLAIEHGCRLGNVPQPLVKYRHHSAQRTRVERRAIAAHRRLIRRRVFRHLFPEATPADETAVLRATSGDPVTADVRERATIWLNRLSATDDPMLRRLMAERRAALCDAPRIAQPLALP